MLVKVRATNINNVNMFINNILYFGCDLFIPKLH